MVKINRVTTKGGDDGSTGLVDGSRVSKGSLRIAAVGEIDELNASLGLVGSAIQGAEGAAQREFLTLLHHALFDLGAEIASPPATAASLPCLISERAVATLEEKINAATHSLPELTSFVLPPHTREAATWYYARAVARRAERALVALHHVEPVRPIVLQFVNRLSDLLFVMTRKASIAEGGHESLWKPGVSLGS